MVPHERTPVSALCKQMLLTQTSLDVQAEGLKINPAGALNFWLQPVQGRKSAWAPARVVHILILSGNKNGFRVKTASVLFAIRDSIQSNFIRLLIGSRGFNESTESNMPASRYSMTLCVQPSIRMSAWHQIAQTWHRDLKWSGKSSQIKSVVIYRAHLKQPQWTGLLYKLCKYIKQNYWHTLKSTKTPSNQTRIQKQQQQKKKWVFSVLIKHLASLIWKDRLLHRLGASAEEALSPLLLSLRLGISESKRFCWPQCSHWGERR